MKKQINLSMDAKIIKEFKDRCKREGRIGSFIVEQLIVQWLKNDTIRPDKG